MHAIERAVERLGVKAENAPGVLLFIYQHGHEPCGKEWDCYGISPHWELEYRCHAARMVIINPHQGDGLIVTVVVPYFRGVWHHPNIKELRGMSVEQALRRYRQA